MKKLIRIFAVIMTACAMPCFAQNENKKKIYEPAEVNF